MTYQKLLKKTEVCEHADYDENGHILPNPGNFAVSISCSILEGGLECIRKYSYTRFTPFDWTMKDNSPLLGIDNK